MSVMIVTLTTKGQLTLPKAIRDEMKLEAGSKLEFSVTPDGTLTARPMRTAASVFGVLRRPGHRPVSVDDMNRARDARLRDKHDLPPRAAKPEAARRKP
jgi:AbrB family looped-hinge helix DNA binding protein